MRRIQDGFTGQKMLVLPEDVNKQSSKSLLTQNLYITNIGYFPNAHFHYVKRNNSLGQFILVYCVNGEGWYQIKQRYSIKAGQSFILPANQSHLYGATDHNPWTIYWLHFAGYAAKDIWNIYRDRHFPIATTPFSEQRITLFNKLYDTLEKGYSREHIHFTNLSLGYFLNSFLYPNIFDQNKEQKYPLIIDQAIECMQQNISTSISLKQLAKQTNYSIPHLSSEFKKKTGYTVIDYHNRLRIQKACQYLDLTDMRIKEISYTMGFEDPYYFSRLFSKIMNISPSSYRNRKDR